MANPNPHKARQALKLKQRRKAGSLSDALLIQWRALKAAETAMYAAGKAGDRPGTLKAVHAITQASTAYAKLIEVGELEARLMELEKSLEQRRNGRAYA